MPNAFEIMTSPFDFLPGLGAVCRWNCQQVQRLLLFKQIVDDLYLPVFQYTGAVVFVQQFVKISSAKQTCYAKLPLAFIKARSKLLTFARWCHFVWWIGGTWKNVCVQNKTMLKCAKNHRNRFRYFEDISRCKPSNIVAYFFGPPWPVVLHRMSQESRRQMDSARRCITADRRDYQLTSVDHPRRAFSVLLVHYIDLCRGMTAFVTSPSLGLFSFQQLYGRD